MRSGLMMKLLPALAVCLILAGVFASVAVNGQTNSSIQESQLAGFVSAAESSRAYANAAITTAAADGLPVADARSQLTQGDALLATAQAYAQAGTNLMAGLQAVQAAMSDYASAATSASLELRGANLTAAVDYSAAVSAVAEVNATLRAFAEVSSQACGAAGAPQAYAQSCTQVDTDLALAGATLRQAASVLAESNGRVATSADITQARSLADQARTEVQGCQSLLLTIASYGYTQRGQAYITAVVDQPYASANATIRAEDSLVANLTAYQNSLAAYAAVQGGAKLSVSSAASALATAISTADAARGSLSTGIGASESAAGQVSTAMSSLLGITAISLLPNVVADINACSSNSSAYDSSLAAAQSWEGGYGQTSLSGFGAYLSTGDSAASAVQSEGGAFASACNAVVADLSGLTSVAGVPAIYNTLVSLQLSGTVGNVDGALTAEVSYMTSVQGDVAALASAFDAGQSAMLPGADLLATAAGISTGGGPYLNATGLASLAYVSTSAQQTSQAAQSYVSSAQACLQATVGGYAGAFASFKASGASLGDQIQGSISAEAAALAYVQSDSQARVSEVGAGQADVAGALSYFSAQNVPQGIGDIAQASFEFQAAAGLQA